MDAASQQSLVSARKPPSTASPTRTELGERIGVGEADWDLEAFLSLYGMCAPWGERGSAGCEATDAQDMSAAGGHPGRLVEGESVSAASECEEGERWICGSLSEDEGGSTPESTSDSEWSMEPDTFVTDMPPAPAHSWDPAAVSAPSNGRWSIKRFVSGKAHFEPPGSAVLARACAAEERAKKQAGAILDSDLEAFLQQIEQDEEETRQGGSGSAGAGQSKAKAKAKSAADGRRWRLLMCRSTSRLHYTAWVREGGQHGGSMEFRGRMLVLRGVRPDTVRDFLLDEVYRGEWDENREASGMLEDWDEAGCSVARWVRRLPLFLRSREYVVARRVWSPAPHTFYCISQDTLHESAPIGTNPVRVSAFSSSWRVRSPSAAELHALCLKHGGVESEEGQGQVAVEILTYYEEESGLQKDLVRMGVAHSMWGHMQKMEQALQNYAASKRSIRHLLPYNLIKFDVLPTQAQDSSTIALPAAQGAP